MENLSAPRPPQVAVFFYGSYMNARVLGDIGVAPRQLEVGALAGFDIDVRPVANVVPSEGSAVWGILTTVTHAELDRVYAHARDVLGRVYLPHSVVIAVGGVLRPALCYIAAPTEPAPASDDYIDRIVTGARAHELPAGYIDRLERFRPAR